MKNLENKKEKSVAPIDKLHAYFLFVIKREQEQFMDKKLGVTKKHEGWIDLCYWDEEKNDWVVFASRQRK